MSEADLPACIPAGNGDGRHILACFLMLPTSLGKSAHLVMLKYLRRLGWRVTVLTVQRDHLVPWAAEEQQWHGIRILRVNPHNWRWRILRGLQVFQLKTSERELRIGGKTVPHGIQWGLNRAMRVVESVFSFPDSYCSAFGPLVAAADRLAAEDPFDLVLSLYHPIASHALAKRIATTAETPWVALTKDFYSWPVSMLSSWSARIANYFKAWYEVRLLRSSRCVLAINDGIRDHLRTLLYRHTIDTLAHCYDEEDFANRTHAIEGSRSRFRLVTVGRVTWSEEPGLHVLLTAIQRLLDTRSIAPDCFRLVFIGHGEHIVRSVAQRYQVDEVLEVLAPVSHEEALDHLQRATCLLFQQASWGSRRRLPEYFATHKPIIAFPSYAGTSADSWLRSYRGAKIVNDTDELQNAIIDWYCEFLSTGKIDVSPEDKFVQSFAASNRAGEVDGYLAKAMSCHLPRNVCCGSVIHSSKANAK